MREYNSGYVMAGTWITVAGGNRVLVEELIVGQEVLTMDHGAQPIMSIRRVDFGTAAMAGRSENRAFLYSPEDHDDGVFVHLDTLIYLPTGSDGQLAKARDIFAAGGPIGESFGWRVLTWVEICTANHEILCGDGISFMSARTNKDGSLPRPVLSADQVRGVV